MLFNSIHFLLFFPVVVTVHFLLPQRFRWMWLLAASYYFYIAWIPAYVTVIWLLTAIDYVAGRVIGGAATPKLRKTFLALSITSNLGLLFAFKYYNFFNETLRIVVERLGYVDPLPFFDVILPLGISFHTFQALSYTIDVYRGKREPERHLGIFALYIAFFPQLVAGPIERAGHMIPQLRSEVHFDYDRVVSGLRLMLWGLYKKVVVADRLAVYVNQVYDAPARHPGGQLLLATYFFAYQIYCDFSGYTDIAIGAARVLGYELARNFNQPYGANSVAEFWHRWHISLSTWFRDYVYIPLGGSRVGPARLVFNLMVVFLVSGMWHGANWTFLVWGALHGVYVVVTRWTAAFWERVPRAIAVLLTFHMVLVAWVFFRAATLADAVRVLQGFVSVRISDPLALASFDGTELAIAIVSIAVLELVHVLERRDMLRGRPVAVRWACYVGLIMTVLLFGKFDERQFIYFQF